VRIVHVSDCYAPRTGGIETQVAALAIQQAASGDDVAIITATPAAGETRSGRDVVDGIPVHRVAARIPFDLPLHPRATSAIAARLADLDPDVVHVHAGVVSPFAWPGVWAARGRPTLVTVHSIWGPIARRGFGLSDAVARWSAWGATMSAVSGVAARAIEEAVPRAAPVIVVPNGIDPSEWTVAPRAGEPDVLRVVSVLRMAPRKRTMALIEVIEQAAAHLTGEASVRAVLVGDGPERASAERYVERRGLPVRFAGRLAHAQILDELADSDVFVQASVRESFGLAALEARTAGLPVVARSQAGTSEFVRDGVEGLLADSDAGLARALARLGRDPGLRSRLAEHNRTTAPAQAWPRVLTTVRAAYARSGAA
jgi:glycosyltransferase involved in cell wall biosynthesis